MKIQMETVIRNIPARRQKPLVPGFLWLAMAERELTRSVELKAGEHAIVELGELLAGEQLLGSVKDAKHDTFLFTIVDEKNIKKFMENEEEANLDDEEMVVLAEGDGKGHYQIDAEVMVPGKYFLVVESEALTLKRKIKVHLKIS